MKNAHKEELNKTHRSQLSGLNADIDELRLQYEYVLNTKAIKIFHVKELNIKKIKSLFRFKSLEV